MAEASCRMAPKQRDGQRKVTNPKTSRKHSRQKELSEIERITKSIREIPAHSTRFLLFRPNRRQKKSLQDQQHQQQQRQHVVFNAQRFIDLPLSSRTLDGLAASGFTEMTSIQKLSLPQSLAERDILAAAPTGSGKTLSFIIPILEKLWRERWTTMDGLGALILSPTRELSMQIFDVLRKVAIKHPISAGLVIGGKDFQGEIDKVGHMNILVGTPGRVLHHMDTVVDMNCNPLKLLVLDEADRILDMGFKSTIDAILKNLPNDRQTLLFSATQTKDIKALARLSLKSPEYLSVTSNNNQTNNLDNTGTNEDKSDIKDEKSSRNEQIEDEEDDDESDTNNEKRNAKNKDCGNGNDSLPKSSDIKIVGVPAGLIQTYTTVKLEDKLSVLWSFIKTHLKTKMIIFLSSGKQVRFIFEAFCKLRPGMSLLHMHGNMKQSKRTEVYNAFCRTKSAALFATDIASRGLDFPDVEWVVQVDCPDDVATYIHRVGRTARLKKQGRAMLILNQGKEEKFLNRLKEKDIANIEKKEINMKKMTSIEIRVSGLVTGSVELRAIAQKAFVSYVKAIWQKSDKDVFNITELDIDGLARSFGLSVTPRVKFKASKNNSLVDNETAKLKTKTVFGYDKRFTKNAKEDDEDEIEKEVKDRESKKKRKFESEKEKEDEDGILTVKRSYAAGEKIVGSDENEDDEDEIEKNRIELEKQRRKRKKRKLDLLKGMGSVNRMVFDEDGNAVRAGDIGLLDKNDKETAEEHDGIESYANSVTERLKETAADDKLREKGRVKALHAKKRAKQRELSRILGDGGQGEDGGDGGTMGVVVGDVSEAEDNSENSDETPNDGSDSENSASSIEESENGDEDLSDDVDVQEQLALKILEGRST